MKLRVTIAKHLKMLSPLIFITILYSILIIYTKLYLSSKGLYIILGIYSIMNLFPVLFIHYNYSIKSSNICYTFSTTEITKSENNTCKSYNTSEISEIVIYAPANLKSGFRNFSFEDYHYAEIKFNNGEVWYLTSLLTHKIEELITKNFDSNLIKKVKKFYPYI